MDEPKWLVNAGFEAAERSLTFLEKGLSFLEKHGFKGISEKRKRRLQSVQKQALEEDGRNQAYRRLQVVEDTALSTRVDILKAVGNVIMSEAQKYLPGLTPNEMTSYLQDIGTTLGAITQQAYNDQLAREKIAMIALDCLEQNKCKEIQQEEPTDSWMAQFLEYAGKIRDEDIAELWGKILAGEYVQPGSYSLRTLNILYTLDKQYANMFKSLVPYIINNDFVLDEVINKIGISITDKMVLESNGLIITSLLKRFKGSIIAYNKFYVCNEENGVRNLKGTEIESKTYKLPCITLTPYGKEIANILTISKDAWKKGIIDFADIVNKKYDMKLQISEHDSYNINF